MTRLIRQVSERGFTYRSRQFWSGVFGLSAYSPLFVILGFRGFYWPFRLTLTPSHVVEWVVIAVAGLSLGANVLVRQLLVLTITYRHGLLRVPISAVSPSYSTMTTYLISYVLPLMLFPAHTWSEVGAWVLSLGIVGTLGLTTSVRYVNLPLMLMGFRFYEARVNDQEVVLLTKTLPPIPDAGVHVVYRIAGHNVLVSGEGQLTKRVSEEEKAMPKLP
ncbi:hypothetical protein [Sulfobacillus thermosulfidooxidans]|uniref:hypothetical protein n=1 Tax=Sulfobacillus thermosulfidooxidans TaxID=28034 RepID=UPI0006B4B784|nr:hypothetical protein [Sulfobacillus thermosulfidooxidans]